MKPRSRVVKLERFGKAASKSASAIPTSARGPQAGSRHRTAWGPESV